LVTVPGFTPVLVGQPIKSPATGAEHRVRIDLPGGIEFAFAEMGGGTTKITGAIELEHKDSYGQFNVLHHSGSGIVT
jgi:hypothetical protein